MPVVADAMRAVVPAVELEAVSVASLSEEVDLLAAGTVDAAFVWLPAGDDRLATAELRAEPRVVALALDHPLAGRTAVRMCDLAAEPVIGPHSSLPAEVMRWWVIDPRPGGAPARYGPEARTPEECLQLVAGRKGVWIAPASAATYFSRPRLAWLPVTDAPPFRLAVAWMRNNRPALLDGFVERCRELADAEL
jgi:DNA-binding transcriptional LysR family regulator